MAMKNEVKEEPTLQLDTEFTEEPQVIVPVKGTPGRKPKEKVIEEPDSNEVVNCLRNERVILRHIDKAFMGITNPKHVLSGGMSINAIRKFSVPRLSSGIYVNVLTNKEKECLEDALGLEKNSLSIHRKVDNFWDDGNGNGISQVLLGKEDNYFDLSKPEDYIRYKILLANKNLICPSLEEYQKSPKATYQYVIINEGDEAKSSKQKMTSAQKCLKEYGKIEDDKDTLRLVVETITGKPTSMNVKLDWLQVKAFELAQNNSTLFLATVTDEYLQTKVLIKKAVEAGLILFKGKELFLAEDKQPLCEYGQDSTLEVAAKYLNSPKNQSILFALQAKLK